MNKKILSILGILILFSCFFVVAQNDVINLRDWVKVQIVSPVEENGGIPVNVQDQTTPPLDLFFTQQIAPGTMLIENTAIDDRTINVTSAINFSVGDYVGIFSATGDNRFFFAGATGISGNIISLDTPLDNNFTAGIAFVLPLTRDLNVDGSTTPQIFAVRGTGPLSTLEIDITRIMISFITDSGVSLAEFGDIPSLDNGIVLRRTDGTTRNIFNVKNNGEIAALAFDYDPHVSTNPVQGQDGANFRFSFAGQEKHGVAIRLGPNDELQIIVQDDLEDIQQFRMIAEGHIVQD